MIVLDTHAWIWWANDDPRLSAAARKSIEDAAVVGVPAISCWEVSTLVAKERLRFGQDVLDWLRAALAPAGFSLLPLTPEISVLSTQLGRTFPADPSDRLIAATAIIHGAPIVSRDRAMHECEALRAIW